MGERRNSCFSVSHEGEDPEIRAERRNLCHNRARSGIYNSTMSFRPGVRSPESSLIAALPFRKVKDAPGTCWKTPRTTLETPTELILPLCSTSDLTVSSGSETIAFRVHFCFCVFSRSLRASSKSARQHAATSTKDTSVKWITSVGGDTHIDRFTQRTCL